MDAFNLPRRWAEIKQQRQNNHIARLPFFARPPCRRVQSSESQHSTCDTDHSSGDDLLRHILACVLLVTYQNHWQRNLSTCWWALCWSLASVPLSSKRADRLRSQIKSEHCQCCNKTWFVLLHVSCGLEAIFAIRPVCNFPSVRVLTLTELLTIDRGSIYQLYRMQTEKMKQIWSWTLQIERSKVTFAV